MLWSSLNKFKFFTTYNNHVVRGGQWKTESFQAGSHMYNTKRLFLKTPENILKYTNFIGRNVILNFYKIDIYLLFIYIYIWKLQTKVIKGHSYCHKKQRKATCKRAQQLPTMLGVERQQCSVRFHGAKSSTGFKLCATTSNNMQQGVQTDATCNIQQCWELLVNNVASVCTQPNTHVKSF